MSKIDAQKGDLLVEFFSEEIPARFQVGSGEQLENLFVKKLVSRELSFDSCKTYTGPRHLAIIIRDIDLVQKDQLVEKRGPRLGSDEKAINGFLKSNNINLSDTIVKKTNNGDFYFYLQNIVGEYTAKILPDIINEIIFDFLWSKSQRWAYSDLKWARPLRNILILLNDEPVEGEIRIGKNTFLNFTNFSFGHRHHNQKIIVKSINQYEDLLKNNNVIIDRETRKNKILSDIDLLLNDKQLKLKQDNSLLDEITGLVEFPNVMLGTIDNEFLSLPPEVLSTAMKVHQKYFTIFDNKKKLAPKFIFVSNALSEKNRNIRITEGNQRVLRARLSDASFFWKVDTSNSLDHFNKKLKKVLFYDGLGSIFDKTIRLAKISDFFAPFFNLDPSLAKEAALLSKADLASEMVGEFPELQGIMGGYYSKINGAIPDVSIAISEHYKPKGLSDELPKSNLGAMLSVIDNIDTLTGFFVINKKPTGSKDPFALRRSGFSIVKILIKFKVNISISDLFTEPLKIFDNSSEIIQDELYVFIIDKLSYVLKKEGFGDDIIKSIIDLPDLYKIPFQVLYKRIQSIKTIHKTQEFKFFLSNFKRLNNIIKTNELPEGSQIFLDQGLFEGSEEEDIFKISNHIRFEFAKNKYQLDKQEAILYEITKASTLINMFFENIIVNHKDNIIKNNRLELLIGLRNIIIQYTNFNVLGD
ncbi:glycine--tRNA ligase subunit beta [Candidatus Levibacter sp. Uisw_134_01]|uniref:glycine--tRNA ligase subunit beta n=1 Tax=Candidatus Levibacter sp. Uisw_134_01 TaxID=3230999 RepID=UPI003D3D37E9